ncbi:MAG: HPr family phosphocarrier protein [Gammaproteobacteria bacterium]
MNSIRYRIANPWGLHARLSCYIVSVANTCAQHWEVIATVRGPEANAKSIMGVMMLGG